MSEPEGLGSLLARHGLAKCPACDTPMTAENLGWNLGPEGGDGDFFPIVYIACKVCKKRLKVISLTGADFAKSRDDAIKRANEAGA